ncbi:phage tail protein [Escherichia coli]|uniref:phage tail protein n=20 Tax=Escherichia coli TaxID=562 RepID=UPI00198F42C2|nr:phage tail protein [Escherichia coli]MCV3046157.1 phage tail protein [Escherichia coli]HAM8962903.1 phage tail protein [Escherichia coli]
MSRVRRHFSGLDMEVNSQPSVREVRFGDGYSQRMAAGLNADLKTYRVTLSVTREEARHLEAFLAEHGGWKAFLWTPPYAWRQIKVTCAAWSSRVRMLRVEFSAEFKQVVN